MHAHSPSRHKNIILRFLAFLASPAEIFGYYMDGTDLCYHCGISIALPSAYYNPLLSFIYFLAGFIIGEVMIILPYLKVIIAMLLSFIFHHMFCAAVFSCCLWMPYDPSEEITLSFYKDAQKELQKKALYLCMGLVVSVVL